MHVNANTVFDLLTLTLGVKVTCNVAQYHFHYVIYAAAKFEVATSNVLGEDAFARKIHYFTSNLYLGVKVAQKLPCTLYIM